MNFKQYHLLKESKNSRSLIIVDVQPEYSGMYDGDENPIFSEIISFAEKSNKKCLLLFNAENQGYTNDTISDIKMYWEDWGFTSWYRTEIIDKGYGYLRGWMDSNVPERIIIKCIREMYQRRITDSREIVDYNLDDSYAVEEWKKILNYNDIPDDPLIVNWVSIKKLKEYENSLLMGGAREQCLKEVELMMNAFNIRYKRVDSLIYD